MASGKISHLAFRFLAFPSIAFLQLAGENARIAFDLIDLIIRKLAPSLLDLVFELPEVALSDVFGHDASIEKYGHADSRIDASD